jgi:hypothetical protein
VHVFKDTDLDRTLVSLADYCNRGCTATLTVTAFTIHHDATSSVVATGHKLPTVKLWAFHLQSHTPPPLPQHSAGSAIHHEHNADYVAFMHAALGSPPISTLFKTLGGDRPYLQGLPRLTTAMVKANPPTSIAMAKGHFDLTRCGQHSTKGLRLAFDNTLTDTEPLRPDPSLACYTHVLDMSDAVRSDATGHFPVMSRKGNNYVLVFVIAGYVHPEPLPSRTSASYLAAFKRTREWPPPICAASGQ